jgi:isopenicillin N synthase-like dioxygenase
MQDQVGGLQVFKDGLWHNVTPVPGAFVINIGDMVQLWSNNRYRAALHRVMAMDKVDRYSIPFFFNPSYQTVVEPLVDLNAGAQYRPVHWGEFRRKRADGDFADTGKEVQIADYRLP